VDKTPVYLRRWADVYRIQGGAMIRIGRTTILVAVLATLAGSTATSVASAADVALTGGKLAKYLDPAGALHDKALVKFVKDAGIALPLDNPVCPASAAHLTLRDDDQTVSVALPCVNWSAAGSGYVYRDPTLSAGGVKKILYKKGKLKLKMQGANYGASPLTGPTTFVEVELLVGSTRYCGRFAAPPSTQTSNLAAKVIFKGPSTACAMPPTPTPTPTPTTTATATATQTATPTRTVPAGCTNGFHDGLETDVDCGGPICFGCPSGKLCSANADCQSSMCSGGHCL
jgi:hypothetical protein